LATRPPSARYFVAVAADIVDAGRSDHLPIWADLERIDP